MKSTGQQESRAKDGPTDGAKDRPTDGQTLLKRQTLLKHENGNQLYVESEHLQKTNI